jgi:alkane 1-monooxygenase
MLNTTGYLLAFILPLNTFFYLWTAPHGIASSLIWTIPFWLLLMADWISHDSNPQPGAIASNRWYDGILYALSLLQIVNIVLMLDVVSQLKWGTQDDMVTGLVNLIVIRFLVGTSSGTSGIVVAHELIHRSQIGMQLLGRILLFSVCYEHFVITHTRGHHLSIGMPYDIATARFNESFSHYWKRIYLGHLRYAWFSEQERLGLKGHHFLSVNLIKNQVFQGLLVELVLLGLIAAFYGWLAVFMFLYQSLAAVRILEAVNYFQHWGLDDKRYASTFGWVTDSQVTRYALIGLSHHIGHHENEQKHYHEIVYSDQGPRMPYGYFVMNFWVKLNNAAYQQMAIRELKDFSNDKRHADIHKDFS